MYFEICRLKELGLKVSQIARHLKVSRNTVYKYKELNPEELKQIIEEMKTRQKKLDCVSGVILSWLKEFPDLSAAQIQDWLIERHPEVNVCQKQFCLLCDNVTL